MNRKRYVLHRGPVRSRNNGQIHFIGTRRLAALYGVNPSVCITPCPENRRSVSKEVWDALVHLYPDPTERYELPRAKP